MTLFLQVILNGLVLGSEYVLVAIGFTLIFGVMGVMNVAQADFYALGPFVMIWISVNAGLGLALGAASAWPPASCSGSCTTGSF